jgi:diadenosine tetraphosphate (Ap4A) HIT family hydrolase
VSDWEDDCPICLKHLRQGPLAAEIIHETELLVASHAPITEQGGVYLGYLFVEPRRHVAELGDLTEQEAEALGLIAMRLSRVLQQAQGAEHIYAAVVGHHVEHLHLHLIARYPDTPPELNWTQVTDWEDAPRGNAVAVSEVAARIRAALT